MESAKRVRNDYSDHEVQILEEAYQNGMINASQQKLAKIKEVACRLSISVDRVKCDILAKVGCEFGGLGVDPKAEVKPVVIATDKSVEFFVNKQTLFEEHFAASESSSLGFNVKRKNLRKDVGKKFQNSWEKVTGIAENRVPYKGILNGTPKVNVIGLPDGLIFKKPSGYSLSQMAEIMAAQVDFEISEQPETAMTSDLDLQLQVNGGESSEQPEIAMTSDLDLQLQVNGGESSEQPEIAMTSDLDLQLQVNGGESSEQPEIAMTSDLDLQLQVNGGESRSSIVQGIGDSKRKKVNRKRANVQEASPEYIVEELVAKSKIKGKVHYNVKWQGYPTSQNTWEPEHNIPKSIVDYFTKENSTN